MRKSLLLASVFLCTISLIIGAERVLGQDPVDLIWKARALQAMEKIEQANAKMKANPSEKLPQKLKAELMLEFAYAHIIASRDITVKKSRETTSYHLVFNYGEAGMLDVFYTYSSITSECVAFTIARLPKGRCIGLPSAKQGADMVFFTNPDDPNEPGIVFHRSNPLLCSIVDPTTPEGVNLDNFLKKDAPSINKNDPGKP